MVQLGSEGIWTCNYNHSSKKSNIVEADENWVSPQPPIHFSTNASSRKEEKIDLCSLNTSKNSLSAYQKKKVDRNALGGDRRSQRGEGYGEGGQCLDLSPKILSWMVHCTTPGLLLQESPTV